MQRSMLYKMEKNCPYELGEIAVFKSYFRFEVYIGEIREVHIDYWGSSVLPIIRKATLEEKKKWYENDNYELLIGTL